jgi:hypothetical protein
MDYYMYSTIFDFIDLKQCWKISSSTLPIMIPYVQKRASIKICNFLQFSTKRIKDVFSPYCIYHIVFNRCKKSPIVKKSTIIFYLKNYNFNDHVVSWYYGLHVPYKNKIIDYYKDLYQLNCTIKSKYDFVRLLQKMSMADIMTIGY